MKHLENGHQQGKRVNILAKTKVARIFSLNSRDPILQRGNLLATSPIWLTKLDGSEFNLENFMTL